MAHLYDNFDDAFAAYEAHWGFCYTWLLDFMSLYNGAYDAWAGGDDHGAILWLITAKTNIWWMFQYGLGYFTSAFTSSPFAESIYWAAQEPNGGEPPTLTMENILSAMLTADYGELQQFIGIVDAYRVGIMNQPFNAEFYAALARGFTP